MSIQFSTPILGTAAAGDVRQGKTFSGAAAGVGVDGTIPTQAARTITPTTTNIDIPAGIYDTDNIVDGDANLVAGNIAAGVSIFGVTGSSTVAAGDATPAEVLSGITFTSGGSTSTQTGTISQVAGGNTITPTTSAQTAIAAATYAQNAIGVAGDANLVASNIKSGTSIFGVAGSVQPNVTPTAGSQTFSTPGSFTFQVPENVISLLVEIVGAGGGGGGYNTGTLANGGNGGAGAYMLAVLDVSGDGSVTVDVGAGGAGGGSSGTPTAGGSGGNSSVSTSSITFTVAGGGGGAAASASGGGAPGSISYSSTGSVGNEILQAVDGGATLTNGTTVGVSASSASGQGGTSSASNPPPSYSPNLLTGGAGGSAAVTNGSSPGGAGCAGNYNNATQGGSGGNAVVRLSW